MGNTNKGRRNAIGRSSVDNYIYDRISYRVNSLAARFYLDIHEKEDLGQQMYSEIIAASARFDSKKSSPQTYFSRVLDRFVQNHLRSQINDKKYEFKNPLCFDDVHGGFEPAINDPGAGEYSQNDLADLKADIWQLVLRLHPRHQRICKLLSEYSPVEAARKLNIPRTSIYREISEIREFFAENY